MNVLIVGLGSIAEKHINAIRSMMPDAKIYALRSGHGMTSRDGVSDLYSLSGCEIAFDFAIVSNPTSLHASAVSVLLSLRIPLFIEKPVFDSCTYDSLVNEVEHIGIPTYVACNLRFLDSLKFLHDYIRDNPGRRVNEVNVYCGSYLPDWRPDTDFRQCYSAIPELGGGVNIDLIHDIDYTCWIFGMPMQSIGVCRNVSSLGIRAVDYANYALFYPGFTASIILNYYRRDYRRSMEIVFADATWTLDIATNTVTDSEGNTIYKGRNTIRDTYLTQLQYFIDTVIKDGHAENDIRTAYNTLKVCLNYERFD